MDLKEILNLIFTIIFASLLTELIVKWIYKDKKKNNR